MYDMYIPRITQLCRWSCCKRFRSWVVIYDELSLMNELLLMH